MKTKNAMDQTNATRPMSVTQAMRARVSVRAFLPTPVDRALIERVLTAASRAASGGNVQPWQIVVVHGDAMARFREAMKARLADNPAQDPREYSIYPESMKSPYRDYRFELTEAMYATMGIARADKLTRLAHVARNFDFFGAPAGLFCFIDRQMGAAQWSDLGMFLQSAMLLFTEAGVDTCAQEAWSHYSRFVREQVDAPPELMLFSGMAIGYRDPDAPVNHLQSKQAPLEAFARFAT